MQPKYAVDVDALLIYRGSHVYVSFDDKAAETTVEAYPDVRVLTPPESNRFEEGLPFQLPTGRRRGIRLGDVVHYIAGKMGIRECAKCRKRRIVLNQVALWRTRRERRTRTGLTTPK